MSGFNIAALSAITTTDGIKHAVLESLFCDTQVYEWQASHFGTENLRGWCYSDELQHHGSKLWLLLREKATTDTEQLLKNYIKTALKWVNEYGDFTIQTELLSDRINFKITVNYRGLSIEVNNEN